ncbi:DUF4442 domain-containing protein [Stenoxybacter acetivorans]|uniref:DUF4442 domain-containing protein n=1 Tax=Stenoxybacter acetivorans TaxID=422441 RepID=UPI00055CEB94|nr:DUF4442 domain-containing protein [Stenoxybacter acetivorans]
MKMWLFERPWLVRFILNIWPPFLFSGIKIEQLSADFRYCKVVLKDWPGTKNANGTQFGGSLFAMIDPIYSLMLLGIMGKRYFVWDKEAHIDFKKPGVGKVFVECRLDDDFLKAVREHTQNGEKYLPQVANDIKDRHGNVVATVTKTMYIRLKPAFRPKAENREDGFNQ